MHYLDHNATSPLRDEARRAMERALDVGGNPSSVHAAGRAARALLEDSRTAVADLVGARADDVVFTSGGSESNSLALFAAVQGAAEAGERITRLFVSAVEHDSVRAGAEALAERTAGLRLETLPVSSDGVIDLEALRVALREGKGRALVAVMAANNETGVIQPLADVSRLRRESGALFLVDAIQAAGKTAISIETTGADYLSLSAHKLGGPHGVGALVVREGAPFATQITGGGQERGRRAGTENVAGIAGFGAAARVAMSEAGSNRVRGLRDRFESALKRSVPDVIVFGEDASRLGNTSNFAIADIRAETSVMALDLDGVMVSSGAACSSGKVAPSHVLAAMGVPESIASCALRVSFGPTSNEADADAAIASLVKLRARARARAA
jgi:cysteine desulfurase